MFGIDDAFIGGSIAALGSIGGSALSAITGKSAGDREYGRQKEFAQNGITWRVEDAKRAGIHPLYAIGANTPTYSPQAAVGTDFGLSAAGQNIGRAIEAGQTARQRAAAQETANEVGQAQADYYRALTDRARMETDMMGQQSVFQALQDIRGDTIGSMAAGSERAVRTQKASNPLQSLDPKDGIWGSNIPELSRVYAPDGRISALIISDKLHDAVEDIHLFESVPYIINGVQVGWKILNAKKDGAEFYGYRWHDASKQWIRNPNWRMKKPLSYDEAFNRNGYGYSKNRTSYRGRIR